LPPDSPGIKESGGEDVNRTDNPPALPEEIKAKLARLRELSTRAEAGDKEARRELRRVLQESSPQVVAQAADLARRAERQLVKVAAGEPLSEEAIPLRLEQLRAEIAGDNPTPLEMLLAERVVALWFLVQFLDGALYGALHNAFLKKKGKERGPGFSDSFARFTIKWQESAHKRYLDAIRELARVRRLQAATPAVQVNTQINLVEDPGDKGRGGA
jgi:hypothetical protein